MSSLNTACPRVLRFLDGESHDNLGIIQRPNAKQVENRIIPLSTKLHNTTDLPSGLNTQEVIFKERVMWPKSVYVAEKARANLQIFERELKGSKYVLELDDLLDHPFRPSSQYRFDIDDPRVSAVGNRSNALPCMGKKRDELPAALQYVNEVIKPTGDWTQRYSTLMGIRTQQSAPGDEKVRIINMVSGSDYIMGFEGFASALTNTDNAISHTLPVFIFHTEPNTFKEWYKHWSSEVTEWVNLDWTSYDTDVEAEELSTLINFFAPEWEFKELENDWNINASILGPWGTVSRIGGMLSGWILTNLGDAFSNYRDTCDALDRIGILKYLVCVAINGDDITLGFNTRITKSNLEKLNRYSRRTLNLNKVYQGENIWNSKWVICEDKSGEVLMTRPVWRIINSSMFAERVKESIYGSKEYVELALSSQLSTIEEHPYGLDIINEYAKVTKYHISTMSDDDLRPAAELYVEQHSWLDLSVDRVIEGARATLYASAL